MLVLLLKYEIYGILFLNFWKFSTGNYDPRFMVCVCDVYVCMLVTTMHCAKMDELINMQFEHVWTQGTMY